MNATRKILLTAAALCVAGVPFAAAAPSVPLPPLGRLSFTIAQGTASCGGPALDPPAAPPFSGQVDNPDGSKRADLGLGCL